jgi:hypothetical protein
VRRNRRWHLQWSSNSAGKRLLTSDFARICSQNRYPLLGNRR